MVGLQTIQALFAATRYDECLVACNAYLLALPTSQPVLKIAASCLLFNGDPLGAYSLLLKLLSLNSADHEAHKYLGDSFNQLSNYPAACESYLQALKIMPDYVPAFNNLAILHMNIGNFHEARSVLDKAIEISPTSLPLLLNHSTVLARLQLFPLALKSALNASSLSPANPQVNLNLSAIYLNLQDFQNALNSANKALAAEPSNAIAYLQLASSYLGTNNVDSALKVIQECLSIHPTYPNAYIALAEAYLHLNNSLRALKAANKAYALDRSNAENLLKIGSIYNRCNHHEKALLVIKDSINLDPSNASPYLFSSGICIDQGKFNEALRFALLAHQRSSRSLLPLRNIATILSSCDPSTLDPSNHVAAYSLVLESDQFNHRRYLLQSTEYLFAEPLELFAQSAEATSLDHLHDHSLITDSCLLVSLRTFAYASYSLEASLTRIRRLILDSALNNHNPPVSYLRFVSHLACQMELNEYVYQITAPELANVKSLIAKCFELPHLRPYLLPVILCYQSVRVLPKLLQSYFKSHIENIPCSYLSDYSDLVSTSIPLPQSVKQHWRSTQRDTTSKRALIKRNYELFPYPRFRFGDYFPEYMRLQPQSIIQGETSNTECTLFPSDVPTRILIAGCGTGNQLIDATRYANSSIDAVDISESSLTYAHEKVCYYNISNAKLYLLDLLNLSTLNSTYHIIESVGVLHHIDQFTAALSSLCSVLCPNGYLKIGLYSRIAREAIHAHRPLSTNDVNPQNIADLRNYRSEMLSNAINQSNCSFSSNIPDLYTLSEFRDLLFNPYERCFQLNEIQEILDSFSLTFKGFVVPSSVQRLYSTLFPSDTARTNLENWSKLEEQYPDTFIGMYIFWVQKSSS